MNFEEAIAAMPCPICHGHGSIAASECFGGRYLGFVWCANCCARSAYSNCNGCLMELWAGRGLTYGLTVFGDYPTDHDRPEAPACTAHGKYGWHETRLEQTQEGR